MDSCHQIALACPNAAIDQLIVSERAIHVYRRNSSTQHSTRYLSPPNTPHPIIHRITSRKNSIDFNMTFNSVLMLFVLQSQFLVRLSLLTHDGVMQSQRQSEAVVEALKTGFQGTLFNKVNSQIDRTLYANEFMRTVPLSIVLKVHTTVQMAVYKDPLPGKMAYVTQKLVHLPPSNSRHLPPESLNLLSRTLGDMESAWTEMVTSDKKVFLRNMFSKSVSTRDQQKNGGTRFDIQQRIEVQVIPDKITITKCTSTW